MRPASDRCEELRELPPSRRRSSATSPCNCSIRSACTTTSPACCSTNATRSSRDGSDPDTGHDQHRSRKIAHRHQRDQLEAREWLRGVTLVWVPTTALRGALTDRGDLALTLIPAEVSDLLEALDAPPRLAAHLRLVHDVACRLTDVLAERYPQLVVDIAAVHFGAAIHDIGKVVHPVELSAPGSAHEEAGYELLLREGFAEERARFARTHAAWDHADVQVEDLLVSVADKVWKGKRVTDLEQLLVDVLASATGQSKWETFMELDDVLGQLAADADRRLAFQAAYPLNGPVDSRDDLAWQTAH